MSLKVTATVNDSDKHEYDITSLIFKNNKVYSASDDGKIKMWTADLKLEKEIQAHPCSIYALTADNENQLYSCSSDGSIRAWNLDTLQETALLEPPGEQEVWKIFWDDGMLASVNDQGIITLFKNGKKVGFLEMMEQIKDIALKDSLLYTVRDLDLVITQIIPSGTGQNWSYTCRNTIPGRAPLCLVGNYLCYASRDGREIYVNYRNEDQFKQIAATQGAHDMIINAINGGKRGNELILFSGGWDKIVKQWSLRADVTTPTSSCCVEGYINQICVNEGCSQVFAGGADGKLWRLDAQ